MVFFRGLSLGVYVQLPGCNNHSNFLHGFQWVGHGLIYQPLFRHVGLIQQIGLPKIFRHPTRIAFFNQPADCHPKDLCFCWYVWHTMRCVFFLKIHLMLKKQTNRRSDWHPTKLPSLKLTARPWKWICGRRSGFLLGQLFRECNHFCCSPKKNIYITETNKSKIRSKSNQIGQFFGFLPKNWAVLSDEQMRNG